jgi:hypothetical protein
VKFQENARLLEKEYIDIPEGSDAESDDFIFHWSLMCDSEWDSSRVDINQLFILNEEPVRVVITDNCSICHIICLYMM